MAFDAPIPENYDPERDFNGPAAGNYHVSIVTVDEDGGNNREMVLGYEVLAGSTAGQEGLVHRDYFSKSVKAMGRVHQLAIACKMATSEQINQLKAKRITPTYDFENEILGRQLCVELIAEEFNKKEKIKCAWTVYAVDDPKVKDWPKNAGMLKSGGYDVPSSEPTSAPEPVSSPANDDLLSGLV